MPLVSLRHALQARLPSPAPQLPASVATGLALPVAALGVVLVGMNLQLPGLLAWTAAIAMIAFAFGWRHALALVALLMLGGVLLWRAVLSGAAVLGETGQMTYLLVTGLAFTVGQLLAAWQRQREAGAADQGHLEMLASTIEALFEASGDCVTLLATDGTILAINDRGVQLLGADSAEQVIGRSGLAFYSAEQQPALATAWQAVLSRGHAGFDGTCRILTGARRSWCNALHLVRPPASNQSCIVCVSRDVSDSLAQQQALKTSTTQLGAVLNCMEEASLVLDHSWMITFASGRAEQLCARMGFARAIGCSLWEVFSIEQDDPAAAVIRRATVEQAALSCVYFHAGQRLWLQVTASPFAEGMNILVRDITALREAERVAAENSARLLVAQDVAGVGDWSFDYDDGALLFSARAAAMLELESCAQHECKQRLLDKLDSRDRMALVQAIINCTEAAPSFEVVVRMPSRAGGQKHLRWVGRLFTAAGAHAEPRLAGASRLLGAVQDISADVLAQEALVRDDLTGLPNRKALLARLVAGTEQSRRCALLLLNLDRFKNINGTLGHGCGDELLRLVAARLRIELPDDVFLARTSGDEFAIVCDGARSRPIVDAILACFATPFPLPGEPTFVTASLGIAQSPDDSEDAGELLRFAGAALQRAKAAGRNNCQWFKSTMLLPSRERLALENELHTALQRGEFELFYQGKFALDSGLLTGAEALLRWRSQKRGLVAPADFVPLLEETGLILPVGEWILESACQQVRRWRERTGDWLPVAVNVSVLQIASRTFADKAIAILRDSALPPDTIELEITESALMADADHGAQLIRTLKAAGFSIALDDFGTGYSSLGYLRKFMPNTLKIDRSFIADLTAESSDREIVAGIVQLAKAVRVGVVAEGIELVEQRSILCELGCAHGQGYLFGRPLPAAQFERGVMAVARPAAGERAPSSQAAR